MITLSSPAKMQSWSLAARCAGRGLGFVPTMGALHEGHISLIRRSRRENSLTAVSIFVNPSQFGPKEDLSRYPRPLARDKALCRAAGVDVLFLPRPADMYPGGYDTWIDVEELSRPLCGPFRPGHFRGVATVVAQLFNLVQPDRAYFGEKDFQQLRVIQRMVRDLHMPVRVIPCPTVREPDGLALSSRNAYLSAEERRRAGRFAAALRSAAELVKSRRNVVDRARRDLRRIPGAKIQYVALVDAETLGPPRPAPAPARLAAAVLIGKTRLIDNRPLETSRP